MERKRSDDPILELKQKLYSVFQENGVQRVVAYYNKERLDLSVDNEVILMVESAMKGIEFCKLLAEIAATNHGELITVVDIHHFQKQSNIDKHLALEGTEIYVKEKTKNRINLGYIKEIRSIVQKVRGYCKELTSEEFEESEMLCEACEYNLHRIGELSNHIEGNYKEDNPQIPWTGLSGFEEKLTLTYPGANKMLLWEIIQEDFPRLQEILGYMIDTENEIEVESEDRS